MSAVHLDNGIRSPRRLLAAFRGRPGRGRRRRAQGGRAPALARLGCSRDRGQVSCHALVPDRPGADPHMLLDLWVVAASVVLIRRREPVMTETAVPEVVVPQQ